MAHEDHSLRCSNNGRISKKLKNNKVPQRGMGVAQLEKIILEEKQMKDVSVLGSNSTNLRPPPVIPPPPPPLPPNNQSLIPRTEAINGVFVSKPMNGSTRNGSDNNWSRFVAMPTNLGGLAYESDPLVWPPLPRSHFQQPSTSSSMVNVSLGTTSTSSSIMNFQMEPPSNQSYYGNKYTSYWQDEEKMVGMKRSYPFLVDNIPIPTFNCKFPSAYVSPIARFDESACRNGGTASLERMIPIFREKPQSLGVITDQKTKKLVDDNRGLTKDFLTLAPPRASPRSHSSSKEKFTPLFGQTKDTSGTEWSNQQPLHSFFPAANTNGNKNEEAGEPVDLSLKL